MALSPDDYKRLLTEFGALIADPEADQAVTDATEERRNLNRAAAGSRTIADLTRAFLPMGMQGPGYGHAEALDRAGDQAVAEAQGERGARAAKRQAAYPLLNQYLEGTRAEAQLQSAKDIAQKKAEAEAASEQAKASLQLDRDSQERQFKSEQSALDRSAAEQRARIAAEAAKAAAGTRTADKTEGLVKDLGKDLEATPQMKNDLAILNAAAAESDTPGFGPVEGHVPGALLPMVLGAERGNKGIETRQAAKRAVQAYKLKVTGTAASAKETEDILSALGLSETATPEQFRQGLKDFTANGEAAVRQVLAKYPKSAVDEFKARGGVTGIAPQSATSAVRKQGSDGKWYVKTPAGWEPE